MNHHPDLIQDTSNVIRQKPEARSQHPAAILYLLLPLLYLLSTGEVQAQWLPFTNIHANLENLGYSHATWGDFDRDGDLDFVLTGEPGSTIPEMRIYRNDAGIFTDIQAGLNGLSYTTNEWGDFDRDGDLDILVTGSDQQGNPHTQIIRNDNGIFTVASIALPDISDGQATFGDYDHDGDLDILLTGKLMTKVLRNDGNEAFVDIVAPLPSVQSSFCNWIDYNNDGWLDIFVSGDLGGTTIAQLYKNNHGTFEQGVTSFMGLSAGSSKWADLDNDGDQDLVMGGMDANLDGHFILYKNNGDSDFTLIENYTFNLWFPSIDLGDFDNDGRIDIALMSKIQGCGGTAVTILYHNDGNMAFGDVSTLIQGFKRGSVAFGDYNNDGFLDLLFTGLNPYDDPYTEIYRNNLGDSTYVVNTPPTVPTSLRSTLVGDQDVQLAWNRSVDLQTFGPGFTYNLYIGSAPGGTNILSPSSSLQDGLRYLSKPGNASNDTAYIIHNLEPGTYYYGVQAIDNGFLGSAFSTEESFTLFPVGVQPSYDGTALFYPNPVTEKLRFIQSAHSYELYDTFGRLVRNATGIIHEIDLTTLASGIYLLRMKQGNETVVSKLVKE